MNDKDLYAQILGIQSPWFVEQAQLLLDKDKVEISIAWSAEAKLTCSHCGKTAPGYDRRERRWRHLDTCQLITELVADVPRVNCPEHGVAMIDVPWAEPGSRYTALFERVVIDWLKVTSIQALMPRMRLSWNAIDGIMQRSVKRGLKRRKNRAPKHISVDETSFQKRHEYVTVVTDQASGDVVYVADDHTQESLENYYTSLTDKGRANIQSVSMDMWPAFINATKAQIPDADTKIAFDKFHVAKHLNDALNKVRREEHKDLKSDDNDILKGTRFDWLKNPENMERDDWNALQELVKACQKTGRAWSLKEMAMSIWHYSTRGWAVKAWARWLSWAKRCRLEPMKKVAKMIERHLWGIINAVVLGVTNGIAESINAKIQKIKATACGFRNRKRFRNAILFHLGGLELYPEKALPRT